MPESLPFAITAEVEQWLLSIHVIPEKEPGISCSPRYGVYCGRELVEEYSGEHYIVGHTSLEMWRSVGAACLHIAERAFWVLPDTLEKLQGKTLTIVERDVAKTHSPTRIRRFIVAV